MLHSISKKDLKSGYYVKLRNGMICIVLKDCETVLYDNQEFCFISMNSSDYCISDRYTDDLSSLNNSDFDVIEVRTAYVNTDILKRTYNCLPIIWKREEDIDNIETNSKIYQFNFEIGTGSHYHKRVAIIKSDSEENAWEEFNNIIMERLKYDMRIYNPVVKQIDIPSGLIFTNMREKKCFNTMKDNNYSFEVGV